MRDRDGCLIGIKAIEREYLVLEFALEQLLIQTQRESKILKQRKLDFRDLQRTAKNLEGTYIIRLLAEFESALRRFWATTKETRPRTKDLIDSLAAHRRVSQELLDQTHEVRIHRNLLVHGRTKSLSPLPVATARGICCKFLSQLPDRWD